MRRRYTVAATLLLCLLVSRLAPEVAAEKQDEKGHPRPLGLLKKDSRSRDKSEDVDMRDEQFEIVEEEEEIDKPKETIAHILDEALKEEFSHEEEKKADVGKQFNETVSSNEGTTETVVIISQKKDKERAANRTAEYEEQHLLHPDDDLEEILSDYEYDDEEDRHQSHSMSGETDVDRIIDSKDNEYVLSKPNEEGSMGLTLDPRLIRDLGVLIAACAVLGLAMEMVRQPTINGYFVAGSLVGPGGLKWIKEIVQVQSVAQLGVVLLLFTLGLELNLGKLRSVRDVAIFGGALQIVLMSTLGGVAAAMIGAGVHQGAFVGAMLSMSSTSVVVKCLQDARASHTPHAQITIGTLVLQDCVVGLLFAFMPVLANAGSNSDGLHISELLVVSGRVFAMLAVTIGVAVVAAKTFLPALARFISKFSAETFQMTILGFALAASMAATHVGVSAELGAFLAGVLLSVTEQQESMVVAAEPVTQLFLALFIASTGLTIPPAFISEHLLVLAAVVAVVVTAKSLIIAGVVLVFRFPMDTALAVGINLAQIGEFGFVLLSMANQQGIIPSQVYLLLMGSTALSLLLTPFMLQLSVRLPRTKEALSPPPNGMIASSGGNGGGGGLDDLESPSLMKRRSSGVALLPLSPRVTSPPLATESMLGRGGMPTQRHFHRANSSGGGGGSGAIQMIPVSDGGGGSQQHS